MPACVFCQIVEGAAPAHVLAEDATTLAFLDAFPATEGHALVVPKTHVADLLACPVDLAADVMRMTHRIARLVDEQLQPAGINVLQANRAAAWQSVFHLHVHVVPRYPDDGLRHTWEPGTVSSEQLAVVRERILEG